MPINDEFSALKRRVATKAKNFKANFLNYKGSGSKKSAYGNPSVKSGGTSLKEV